MTKNGLLALFLCSASTLGVSQSAHPRPDAVHLWLTSSDRTSLLAEQPEIAMTPVAPGQAEPQADRIVVDDTTRYQAIDGFGFAMTGGSAQLIHRMDSQSRHALLQKIFGQHPGEAAVSYLRVSIGSSDMNDHVFTYDDMPAGQTDPTLTHFTLAEDEKDLIPVLKEVLAISPHLQILASPWSAPSWMKTNELPKGGSLRPEFYPVYAQYLVHYLRQVRAAGVPITALTMQNEPLNPKNTPSMVMEASEEEAFLRDALGPALHKAGLATKVILFDHNCNHPDYPLTILNDAAARAFADGSGFHLYEGEISAMSEVHNAYPQKNLYFTEQMVVEHTHNGVLEPVANPVSAVLIGAMRNWSRTVLLWNLAADPSFGPHTNDGGCPVCQGAITIDANHATENIAFFTIEHASRFVPPGSTRIDSTQPDAELANVAWLRPDGKHVLLVANHSGVERHVVIQLTARQFTATLGAGSVGTFVW